MTQTTEPATEPRKTKPAAELTYGDHILTDRLGGNWRGKVHEVRHAEVTDTSVMVMVAGGGVFQTSLEFALPLATDAEIAAHKAHASRARYVKAVRRLADLIEAHELPVEYIRASVVLDRQAQVEQWAAALGAKVETRGDRVSMDHDLMVGFVVGASAPAATSPAAGDTTEDAP